MRYTDVMALLGRFTFKPNVRFQVTRGDPDARYPTVILHVVAYVPDSTRNHRVDLLREYDEDLSMLSSRQPFYGRSGSWRLDLPLIPIAASWTVPPLQTEAEFYVWLRGCLRSLEDHEFDEWFKVDGKPLNDPHVQDSVSSGV